MFYRDKQVIAWKSFEIGDGILYTDDVKKKKSENVNEDTIGNEIVTSDQLVNAIQGTFIYTEPGCTNCFIYFVKRAIGD